MIFIETLKTYEQEVKDAVSELFDTAFKNQKVDTDLLLIIIHGYYDKKHLEFHLKEKLSPYVFGPEHIGYSLEAFYEFFHFYRTTPISKREFLKAMENKKKQKEMEYQERLTLHLELLIYLKFWESDLLLRQLFNLSNLATEKYYDWDFILSYTRRPFIRNHIQAPIKNTCPKFYQLIEDTYSAQIRNAIAHSKYFFMGRNLQLANKDEQEYYKYYSIPFDEWEVRFHRTTLLYNFIIGALQEYDKLYQDEVKEKHFGLPVSTPRLNHLGLRKNQWVKYDNGYNRWLWSTQLDDS